MSQYCFKCGQELGDDFQFCTKCGSKVADTNASTKTSVKQVEGYKIETSNAEATGNQNTSTKRAMDLSSFSLKSINWVLVLKIAAWILSIAWITSAFDILLAGPHWNGFAQILLAIIVNPWVGIIPWFKNDYLDLNAFDRSIIAVFALFALFAIHSSILGLV